MVTNLIWHCFTGPQMAFTCGTATARRFAPGLPAILGFAAPSEPEFDGIAPFCAEGESFYCADWTGPVPVGWRLEEEDFMLQMVWAGASRPPFGQAFLDAPAALEPQRLTPAHVPEMTALAELTHPGPFGPRNIELGEYFGYFENGRLIAMIGERLYAPPHREISAVCTHPDFQGKGYARRLLAHLLRRQLARGEQPFLHVMRDNPARQLYARCGFVVARGVPVRILVRR